jgi:hypothetical protein
MQVGSLGGAVTEIMAKRVVVLVLAIVLVVPPLTFAPEDQRHQIALDYLESKVYGLQALKNETLLAKPAGVWVVDKETRDRAIKWQTPAARKSAVDQILPKWEAGMCADWDSSWTCDIDAVKVLYLKVW